MSKAWQNKAGWYYQYTKIREQMLNHNMLYNNGDCTIRIPDVCTGKATQIHHTRGLTVTRNDPRYMAPSCGPCNRYIGDPQQGRDPVGIEPDW